MLNVFLLFMPIALAVAAALAKTSTTSSSPTTSDASAPDGSTPSDASNSRFTWYNVSVGLTACGGLYADTDYVVALNEDEFGDGYPGPHCSKTISLSYGGKTHSATIVDKCPGCPSGGLDLTPSLFSYFADLGVGHVQGSWTFDD